MREQNINTILKEVLEKIKPSEQELKIIDNSLKIFLKKLDENLKKSKLNAEIFVGGSYAKKTLIKKDKYDIDVFLRFDEKYKNEEISELTENLIKGTKNVARIHGSRDYFSIKLGNSIIVELIPVKKIKNTKNAENITDLSYSHVKYINKKTKEKKLLDEIRLAKAFCHATNSYGAESYVNGFSGYALELLICHYKSFLKFISAVTKIKEKEIIDIEKFYKNKQEVMMNLNSSKLQSPIILIDPTYKQRNAAAALSMEAFEKFKKECEKFLKNPTIQAFESRKTDFEKIKKEAIAKKMDFALLEAKTDRQEGDIAGSKLLKFFNHLASELSRFFEVKNKGFEYGEKKSARFFFAGKNKGEILISGPSIKDKENVLRFKKAHKKTFEKAGKIYAKEKINFTLKDFVEKWKIKNKDKMKDMDIIEMRIV